MNNTTNDTDALLSSPFVGQSLSNAARAIFATVGSIMILSGVLGNCLLITVLTGRYRRRENRHDLFVVIQAPADCVTSGYSMTFFVLDMILGYHPVVNQAHCKMNGIIINVMSGVCILTLLAITLNRYFAMFHALLYKRLFTWCRTKVICVSIWIVAILIYIPLGMGIDGGVYFYIAPLHQCAFDASSPSYTRTVVTFFTFFPVIVIGYCHFVIFRLLWKVAHYRRRVLRREIKEEEAVVGPGELTDEEKHQQEDRNQHPISASGKGLPRTAATSVDEPDSQEGHAASTATDGGRPDDDTESSSQAVQSLDIDRQGNKDGCERASFSDSSEEQCLQRQMGGEKHNDGIEEHPDISDTGHDPRKDDESTRKSPLGHSGQAAEEATMMVTERQTPTILKPSLSHSSRTSVGKAPSEWNRQEHPTTTDHSLQRQGKICTTEVRISCYLLSVFLLACISCIPLIITMASRSVDAISAELRIIGILLLSSNSSVNWVMYGRMSYSFREACRKYHQEWMGKCFPG